MTNTIFLNKYIFSIPHILKKIRIPINFNSSKEACIKLCCYKGLHLWRIAHSVAHSCAWEWMEVWNVFNTSKKSDNPRNKHSHFTQVICSHCCTFWSTFWELDQKLYSPIKHISLSSIKPLLAWNMTSSSQRQSLTILFSKLLRVYCLSVPGKYFVTCLDESSQHHNKSWRFVRSKELKNC